MKILITGAGGMLGTDLAQRLSTKHQVIGTGRRPAPHLKIPFYPCDLSKGGPAFELIKGQQPEIILHAAAMTQVDKCETDRRAALSGNFETVRNVVEASNRIKSLVIYFGTDFIFDGEKSGPYDEQDLPHPISVYGQSKYLGERYLAIRARRFLILRTAWLFGKQGDNFPKKILRQAEEGKPLRVVSDEVGNPTFTGDLAGAVTELIGQGASPRPDKENQVYHVTNEGTVSRFEFARTILKKKGFSPDLVTSISSEEVKLPAARPRNSALSTEKFKTCFGIRLRPWQEALEAYLQEDLAGLPR